MCGDLTCDACDDDPFGDASCCGADTLDESHTHDACLGGVTLGLCGDPIESALGEVPNEVLDVMIDVVAVDVMVVSGVCVEISFVVAVVSVSFVAVVSVIFALGKL